MAEKDTAAVAQAAVGRSKTAVGCQRAAHRLRLAATAQPCLPICLKNYFLAYDWLTRPLPHAHAQEVGLSICFCTICIGIWAQWVITAIKYSKETDLASFGFDQHWLQGLLVTPINHVLSAHARAVLTYQTTPPQHLVFIKLIANTFDLC